MGLASFDLQLEPGRLTGTVNGAVLGSDTPVVRRVVVDASPDAIPQIVLEFPSAVHIAGEGVIHVGTVGPQANLIEWLDELDPQLIEETIVRKMDNEGGGLGGPTIGESVISVFKELLGGLHHGS